GLSGETPTLVTSASGLGDGVVTDLVRQVLAGSTDTVFAGVLEKGVYKSVDRGVTWTPELALPLSDRIKLADGTDGSLYVAELGTHATLAGPAAKDQTELTLSSVAD